MPIAALADRAVVRVAGETARPFLDGLVTCAMERVVPGQGSLGALLTPQGKILFDFLVTEAPPEDGGGFYLETLRPYAPDLAKRLAFYRLRAKIEIADLSGDLAVLAGWGDAAPPPDEEALTLPDPRLATLGWRALVSAGSAEALADTLAAAYHAHRIALGVPEANKDYLLNDAFPHEALLDQLGGVDFDKGCFVGQEVVSRMQHRGTARSRIVPIIYPEGFAAESGAEVTANGRVIGRAGSGARGRGLALIRLDRAAEALSAGEPIHAGGMPVRIERPTFARFEVPGPVA